MNERHAGTDPRDQRTNTKGKHHRMKIEAGKFYKASSRGQAPQYFYVLSADENAVRIKSTEYLTPGGKDEQIYTMHPTLFRALITSKEPLDADPTPVNNNVFQLAEMESMIYEELEDEYGEPSIFDKDPGEYVWAHAALELALAITEHMDVKTITAEDLAELKAGGHTTAAAAVEMARLIKQYQHEYQHPAGADPEP